MEPDAHIRNASQTPPAADTSVPAPAEGGKVISIPGAALEVRVVPMRENVRVAIGNALSAGKAQRSFGKKFFGLFF